MRRLLLAWVLIPAVSLLAIGVYWAVLYRWSQSDQVQQDRSRFLVVDGHGPPRPATVYPLAGKVTVDGQPPSRDRKLLVMAYDPHSSDPLGARPFTMCDVDGTFYFTSHEVRDGLEPGNYVFLFASLIDVRKDGFLGPDALQNLYNDPDINERSPELVIDHRAPGKSDYRFDLKIKDRVSPPHAGSKALTELK